MPSDDPTRPPPPPRPEKIARVALRAPVREEQVPGASPSDDDERVMRAMAALEGKLLARIDEARTERPALVIGPTSSPPSRMHQLGSVLTAVGAIIAACATVINALKKPAPADVGQLEKRIAQLEAAVEARKTVDYANRLEEANWLAGVFDKLGVKVVVPPGSPKLPPIEFDPPPKFDAKKIKDGETPHPIQPKDPLPFPPPP